MRISTPAVFTALILVTLFLLIVFGPQMVSEPDFIPTLDTQLVAQNAPILNVLTNNIGSVSGLLTAVVLGAFVIVGFALQLQTAAAQRIGLDQYVLAGVLMVSTILSVFFIYASQVQMLQFTSMGFIDSDYVGSNIGKAATLVGIGSSAAFYVALSAIGKIGAGKSQAGKQPVVDLPATNGIVSAPSVTVEPPPAEANSSTNSVGHESGIHSSKSSTKARTKTAPKPAAKGVLK